MVKYSRIDIAKEILQGQPKIGMLYPGMRLRILECQPASVHLNLIEDPDDLDCFHFSWSLLNGNEHIIRQIGGRIDNRGRWVAFAEVEPFWSPEKDAPSLMFKGYAIGEAEVLELLKPACDLLLKKCIRGERIEYELEEVWTEPGSNPKSCGPLHPKPPSL